MDSSQTKPYLTFILGQERFAITVDAVHEIVEPDAITRIPDSSDYMLGVFNLRGKVLPLFDTRLKLGLPAAEITSKNRIIIVELRSQQNKPVGALVDLAHEVIEINDKQIQKSPENERSSRPTITGLLNNDGQITLITDFDLIFNEVISS